MIKINFASGFFRYIPYKEMRVLITNNHVIDQKILNKKKLIIYIEEDEKEK